MTYAALIEDQTGRTKSATRDTQSRNRRQSDKGHAAKNGRRWSDHVEIELVGSEKMPVTDQNFVTAAFAAQVLGQFTDRPSNSARPLHHDQVYQLSQKMMAASENSGRLLA